MQAGRGSVTGRKARKQIFIRQPRTISDADTKSETPVPTPIGRLLNMTFRKKTGNRRFFLTGNLSTGKILKTSQNRC